MADPKAPRKKPRGKPTAPVAADGGQTSENDVLDAINGIFREALACDSEEKLAKTCLRVAETLTGSQFGFIGELNAGGRQDTIAISDPGWAACRVPGSEAVLAINDMAVRGIWGRVFKDEKSLIVNDPAAHPDRVGLPEGHPPLTAFLGVPLKDRGRTTGMVALANKPGGYRPADQKAVEALAVAIVEALRYKRAERRLAQQAKEIVDLSTPVVQVWEGIVAAPLIGTFDSQRTQQFMERFLAAIIETQSPMALMDITGVPTVDTQTAQHLIEAINAARLLGAEVILTGVRPSIAQTLVHLGIRLDEIETCASLADGLKRALKKLGLRVVAADSNSR